MCEWFLLCTNAADGTVSHPILGDVPTCQRCATKHDLPLVLTSEQRNAIDPDLYHQADLACSHGSLYAPCDDCLRAAVAEPAPFHVPTPHHSACVKYGDDSGCTPCNQ